LSLGLASWTHYSSDGNENKLGQGIFKPMTSNLQGEYYDN